MRQEYESFLERIKSIKSVKIYGAGKFAKTLGYFLLRHGIEVEAFVVSDTEGNSDELLSRPVIAFHALEPLSLCNIVVGLVKEADVKAVYKTLQAGQVRNIITVPSCIVNDIYYNFMVDTTSLDNMILDLKKEQKIFVYLTDSAGECTAAYMRNKNVRINALFTDRTDKFLLLDLDAPLLPYSKFLQQNRDAVVVLAIRGIQWKKSFISRLRNDGFEKIVLFPDEWIKEIVMDTCRKFWEEPGEGFRFIETMNVEKNHYLTQIEQKDKIYRWRNPTITFGFCGRKIQKNLQNQNLLKEYCMQYPSCSFLSYEECPLTEVSKPDMILEVYMAKFHKDKKIASFPWPEWVIPIQVGKALTDISIAECCDNTGNHISEKNVDYSEGTALYWMWKNTHGQDYIGLFHYRRQMAMGRTTLEQMQEYDMLLTVPTCLGISVKDFFCKNFILDFDWELMMKYIREYDVVYYEKAQKHEQSQFYFSCNIFIMRRKYFDEMCSFIFDILEKVEQYYRKNGLERKDRYLGYLVENLLSIYVMRQTGKLKIAYTDMKYYASAED